MVPKVKQLSAKERKGDKYTNHLNTQQRHQRRERSAKVLGKCRVRDDHVRAGTGEHTAPGDEWERF